MANEYLKQGRHGFEKNDCVVIAFSYACELDYVDAHAICKKKGRRDKHGFSILKILTRNDGFGRLREKQFRKYTFCGKSFVITRYPRPGMTVATFQKSFPKGTYIAAVGGHEFCMRDGVVYNQSNPRDIIKYYVKIDKFIL